MQVSLGAGVVTRSVQLDGWAPRVGWRLGLGGRCSVACGSPENAQWVDNLVIRSDVLLQTARVPLSLALNGQQFVSHATFAYQANLRISSVQPSQGPAAGGTHLTLRGGNFDGGARHEYRCRFGSDALGWRVVLGTFDERGGTLRCATPAAPALQFPAAPLELQVSSNGQEYVTNATIPFEYYAQPEIELLTPTGGPALGGTLLLAEPMAQAAGEAPLGDAYFHFYLLAMGSGRLRSVQELTEMLWEVGFSNVEPLPNPMPMQTRILVARKSKCLP